MSRNNKKVWLLPIIGLVIIIVILVVTMNKNDIVLEENELYGEIEFISNRTDKQKEIEELINEFEEIHPGVDIHLELIGDAQSILQRKASIGDLPDVTLIPSTIYKEEYSNYLLPIDDLEFTEKDIYNYEVGKGIDGKLYALNTSINWHGIIYNKEVFKEANIKYIPVTIEELFLTCEKVKAIGRTPIAINYKQSWTMDIWIDVIPHLFEYNFLENIIEKGNKLLDDNSGMYKSLSLIKEIIERGYCEENLLNYEWLDFKNDMSEGKIAMTIWNSDFINQLEDMGVDRESIGMFVIPETEVVKIYGDYKMGIAKNSDNPEVAKAFLKFLFEKNRYANAVNIKSPLIESYDNESIFNELKNIDIQIEVESENLGIGSNEEELNEKYARLKNINGLNYELVQKYILEKNNEEFINEINRLWESSIEK